MSRLHSLPNKLSELFSIVPKIVLKKQTISDFKNIPAKAEILINIIVYYLMTIIFLLEQK